MLICLASANSYFLENYFCISTIAKAVSKFIGVA